MGAERVHVWEFDSAVWKRVVRSLSLSEREEDIVKCILMSLETEQSIAAELSISRHTVHSHLERIYRKVRVNNRAQLVVRLFVSYAEMKAVVDPQ